MEEERDIIELVDEEGNLEKFEVLDIIEEGDARYVCMLPEEEAEDEDTVIIMRIQPVNDEEDMLTPIEDEEELSRVFEIFREHAEEEFEFDDGEEENDE